MQTQSNDRRRFLKIASLASGALALTAFTPSMVRHAPHQPVNAYRVQDIIDLIMKEGGLTPIKNTVDTIKSGSPDQPVTGIITTMFPTIRVIEEAVKRNANFIIAHEPTFYNHEDDPQWVKDNHTVKAKMELLHKHQIAVWRFHDYCHALKPDAITYGVVKKSGWLPYFKAGEPVMNIPSTSLKDLAAHLKSSLNINHLRLIGDLDQRCSTIALLPGAWGGQRQIAVIEASQPDVLIAGEIAEWETAEYIRDTRLLGGKTALIVLGHAPSEEPGMEWVASWLQPKLNGLPVTHLPSGSPFIWI